MNMFEKYSVLVLPGRDGSGSDHWQSHWESAFPDFVRVQQEDWVHPDYALWQVSLTDAVMHAPKPVILIAHSAGTSLTMRWANDNPELAQKIAGAFLVAPSDRDVMEGKQDNPIKGFGPMLLQPLPFNSMVVASRNDPLVTFERATLFAKAWGAKFVDAGHNGHLGEAAQLGIWPAGLVALGEFVMMLEISAESF